MRTVCRTSLLLAALGPALLRAQQAPDPALLQVAAGYAAKVTASALFVSGRTLASVLDEELAPDRPIEALIRPLLHFDVDDAARSVTCRLGTATATAVATRDLGCTLILGEATADQLRRRGAGPQNGRKHDTLAWPRGDRLPAAAADGVDHDALAMALDAAFAEPEGRPRLRTRAVVVVHRGQLVAERYARGYDATMPLPGWSMSKTLVNALVGIRIEQGELDPDTALDVPEWRLEPDDERQQVRLSHLLSMTAGLRWNEDYDDARSDALRMLFGSGDQAAVYAQTPAVAPPGTAFVYASGSTNLICRLLRATFASDAAYHAFPRDALFAPLGMHSAVLETDASGTFVGSSYGFATARDWARFGLLLAADGVAGERRLLPTGWVARSATPAPGSNGTFGWHVWLNADPDGEGPRQRPWPDLPADLLRLDGHEGQSCTVLPTEQIVVVRLGCTKHGGFDLRALLRGAIAACR